MSIYTLIDGTSKDEYPGPNHGPDANHGSVKQAEISCEGYIRVVGSVPIRFRHAA